MTAQTSEGTLSLTGWRRAAFGVAFWVLAFVLLCGLGLAVGLVQASAAAPDKVVAADDADWVEGTIPLACKVAKPGTSGVVTRYIRCNIGVIGTVSLKITICDNTLCKTLGPGGGGATSRLQTLSCTSDPGGLVCTYSNSDSADDPPAGYVQSSPACFTVAAVCVADISPMAFGAMATGSTYPAAYTTAELACFTGMDCYRDFSNMCDQLSFSGPLPGMPWNAGESITITVTIPEGVSWPNLYFYWPGTSFHPERWWDPETDYPRGEPYDYPLLEPGAVEVPRYYVAYPDRWAYPENPYEPLTWAADGTETIKIRRLSRVADGTAGQLRIACAFLLSDGWHLSTRSWDGSEAATPTDFRDCLDVVIDRPNWAEGDPNFPDDPGPWRVYSRTGLAVGPIDIEVWDPEAGDWVAWIVDETIAAGDVIEEPDSVPTVSIDDPDAYSFRCTDAEGTLTGGTLGEVSPEKAADGSKQSCTQSGIGVAPSSWVPGLVKMGSCVTRKLFVPSDPEVQRIRAAGAEASHRAPISFIAEPGGVLISAFSDAPAAIEAHREDCLLLVDVSTLLDGVDDVSACPHSLETSGSSVALSQLRAVLVTVWWLAFAWFLWSSTRRVMNL